MPTAGQPVLLFDLGGVLIESAMFAELKRLMGSDQSEAELIEIWLSNPLCRRFELGQCSMEDFAERVVREFGLALEPEEFLAAFRNWPKGFYGGVESMLAYLRHEYTLCCLSNSNEAHWTDAVTGHFHFAFSSHLIGCIKPDRDAFAHVVDEVGVEAGRVHFFDDAPVNVHAARAFGFNAYHTVGFGNVKAKLKELGFLR